MLQKCLNQCKKEAKNVSSMAAMVTNGLAHNLAISGMGGGVEGGSPVESGQKCPFGMVYMSVHI